MDDHIPTHEKLRRLHTRDRHLLEEALLIVLLVHLNVFILSEELENVVTMELRILVVPAARARELRA